MPLNTLRLNYQPSSHPNERIVFIKPIPRPPSQKDDYDRAELVLKAIAAQCFPIMKKNHLSVTTLEEHEPNREFIGRNFNNGEIIQLVIQSKSGSWLPINMIQMVMMHELAHNTHMNHGKGFWQTRNIYANEMRQLWSKRYTGEGLWGQGRSLSSLQESIGNNIVKSEELANLPLCGGTFRSRRKKRKAKGEASDLTWKEKRDKRIEKKFGKNGNALGDDEDKRLTLEINNNIKGSLGSKPRVAQSKRGRELRAAAALARFETNKKEVSELRSKEEEEGIETESEYEELDTDQDLARDASGRMVTDSQGHGTVRVCGESDQDDVNFKNEMDELANLDYVSTDGSPYNENSTSNTTVRRQDDGHDVPEPGPYPAAAVVEIKYRTGSNDAPMDRRDMIEPKPQENQLFPLIGSFVDNADRRLQGSQSILKSPTLPNERHNVSLTQLNETKEVSCPICSMSNESLRATCVTCSHVLDTGKDPRYWHCANSACNAEYVNGGDCGVCGICGARRPGRQDQADHPDNGGSTAERYSRHIAYI